MSLKIEKTGLFLQNTFYHGAHYLKSIPQCFKCWKIGHTSQWCQDDPLCSKCHNKHDSNSCSTSIPSPPNCVICITQAKAKTNKPINKLDDKYSHNPWDNSCPSLIQALEIRKRQRWKA